jgi:hypothetical protein
MKKRASSKGVARWRAWLRCCERNAMTAGEKAGEDSGSWGTAIYAKTFPCEDARRGFTVKEPRILVSMFSDKDAG